MAKDFNSLKTMVNETKGTVTSAARVIRSLIHDRNVALGAAKPADVVANAKTQQTSIEAADLQDGLDVARKDLDAAIAEAAATPTPVAPATPAGPNPGPNPQNQWPNQGPNSGPGPHPTNPGQNPTGPNPNPNPGTNPGGVSGVFTNPAREPNFGVNPPTNLSTPATPPGGPTPTAFPKHLANPAGIEKVVNNSAEEQSARAAGFTNLIPSPGFPKTLTDTTGQGRGTMVVNSAAEYADAQAKGFTTLV